MSTETYSFYYDLLSYFYIKNNLYREKYKNL